MFVSQTWSIDQIYCFVPYENPWQHLPGNFNLSFHKPRGLSARNIRQSRLIQYYFSHTDLLSNNVTEVSSISLQRFDRSLCSATILLIGIRRTPTRLSFRDVHSLFNAAALLPARDIIFIFIGFYSRWNKFF